MNITKEKQYKKHTRKNSDMTFDKEETKSQESQDFWDDCENDVSSTKYKLKSSSTNSRNKNFSSSLPKNNGISIFSSKGSNGRKVSASKATKPNNYHKLGVDSYYSKTIQNLDPKSYREVINAGALTERERSIDKISNGKTLNTIEIDRTSSCGKGPDKMTRLYKRINQLYLQSNQRKEKINLLKEEQNHAQSEREMKECTFQPKVNKTKKFVKENKDFLNRNEKWKSEVNNKLEKIKTKVEEESMYDFKPSINKKALNFNSNKKAVEDRNTLKYIERINKAKKQKEELNKKLNPDYNMMYDKMYKKDLSNYDDYATFNPNKAKNLDLNSIKMTLHNELNSLTIEQPNI